MLIGCALIDYSTVLEKLEKPHFHSSHEAVGVTLSVLGTNYIFHGSWKIGKATFSQFSRNCREGMFLRNFDHPSKGGSLTWITRRSYERDGSDGGENLSVCHLLVFYGQDRLNGPGWLSSNIPCWLGAPWHWRENRISKKKTGQSNCWKVKTFLGINSKEINASRELSLWIMITCISKSIIIFLQFRSRYIQNYTVHAWSKDHF